jgi:type IV pilus assembly protein PilA
MLLNRSFHKFFLQRIQLLKSRVSCKFEPTSVRKRESLFSTRTKHGFNPTSVGKLECHLPQILRVIIASLTLPMIFIPASKAQVSQTTKAKEAEAKQYVGAMNKAQQEYYAQNTGFTSSIANLALGIKSETPNYKYSISTGNKAVFNYGVSRDINLKSFVGGVFLIGNTTTTILCQTKAATKTKPPNPTNKNGTLACGANTVEVVR